MGILNNLKESIKLLEENDEQYKNLFEQQSKSDKKIDYWLHYIELNNVPVTQAYKIIKEIKKQRQERRTYKNEIELMKVFKDNENKLCNVDNRKILLNQVCKTDKKQKNCKYSYDAYTKEEINEILGGNNV